MNEDMAKLSCEIIAAVGSAKGLYIEAIQQAKKGNIKEAKQCVAEGEAAFLKGHTIHSSLLSEIASGNKMDVDLLLVHAECQMMSAEDFSIIAAELIEFIEQKKK